MKPMIVPPSGPRDRTTLVRLGMPQRLVGATGQTSADTGTESQIAFAATTSVRRLLDAITASGIDLSDASSAEEIAQALTGFCRRGPECEG
jgi:hypothetical protein